jgi:oligosaccharide repeat unit polymerase
MSWNELYIVDVLAIGVFAVSYYRNCYRRGYRIDFWHAQLLLACVFPNMILLPFSRNEMNRLVVGPDFEAMEAALPSVFLITVVGFFAIIAGGSFWRIRTGLGVRNAVKQVLDIIPRCSMMLMSSRRLLVFQVLLCLCLQAVVLSVYFVKNGFGFDLRAFTMANPMLRPVAQTAAGYSVVIASHCLARYVDRKEKILLLCTLLLTLGLVFFGARSNILFIYFSVGVCYLIKLRGRVNLVWLVSVTALVMAVGFYLGNVRAGQYSLLFYGNNFSDLRDFSWVYASWDHVFWGGKTYLAALTSFVPRAASRFRDTWGLGVATATTLGLDPQVHPGVRPGNFGEGFFNFALPGVVVVGVLIGIMTRRVDIDTKNALTRRHPSMMEAFASTQLLQLAGCVAISVNLSVFYVLCGIYLFSWVCLQLMRLTGTIREPVVNVG